MASKNETAPAPAPASPGIVAKVINTATGYVQKLKPEKKEGTTAEPAATSNDIVDTVEDVEGPGEETADTFTEMLKTELPAKIEEMKNDTEKEDEVDGGVVGDGKKSDAGLLAK